MGFVEKYFKGFTREELRNVAIYTFGLVIYKFVLETLGACMSGIVLRRMDYNPVTKLPGPNVGLTWTTIQSINLACQCIGSLLIGPLIKRFRAGTIMATTVLCFASILMLLPILEGATGGRPSQKLSGGSRDASSWTPYLIYLIFPVCGLFSGMIDLMRRVIPNDIVGGDPVKLKIMDSTVHFWWEIAGTTGAILSVNWISYFGWGYAPAIITVGFAIASSIFFFIKPREERLQKEIEKRRVEIESGKKVTWAGEIATFAKGFVNNAWIGARLVCSSRSLFWLLPAYTIPLILHRYLEGTVFPFYSGITLKNTDYQQILNAGSNFGEAMGAVLVFFLAKQVKTPIPYLRADAILILLIWVVPYWMPADPNNTLSHAWALAPIMATISFGWSCGDVAIGAYTQSRLHDLELADGSTSLLGAVMAFLYICNLVFYFILNNLMGRVRDVYVNEKRSITELYIWIAAVAMTAGGVIVLAGTYIPRGSAAWNPDPDTIDFDDELVINGQTIRRINHIEKDFEDKKDDAVVSAETVVEKESELKTDDFIVSKA
ncbi:major facilitator superfamily domain-containing protein [Chytridium lagenaria]|nr:major facilitator superfamily domain-containing protein [Chytridium lagenaria]